MQEEVQISIVLENKPSSLARMLKKLTDSAVDVRTIAGEAAGDRGVVRIITDHPDKAMEVLETGVYKYAKERVISICIADARKLQEVIEKLGASNVNIRCLYLFEKRDNCSDYVFVCDDYERMKKVLGEVNGQS